VYSVGAPSSDAFVERESDVGVAPGFGHLDAVAAVFAERDDVLLAVVQFHEVEFVLSGFDDADTLELLVEFLPEFGDVRSVGRLRVGFGDFRPGIGRRFVDLSRLRVRRGGRL
jgi:hypothetical protein